MRAHGVGARADFAGRFGGGAVEMDADPGKVRPEAGLKEIAGGLSQRLPLRSKHPIDTARGGLRGSQTRPGTEGPNDLRLPTIGTAASAAPILRCGLTTAHPPH